MAGMLLNVKVVAAKGLTSLIQAGRGPPASPLGLCRELRLHLIAGREGIMVQSLLTFCTDQMALGSFPVAQAGDAFCPSLQGTHLEAVAMASLLLSEKVAQKFLSSKRSHCGRPGLWGDIHTREKSWKYSGCTLRQWVVLSPK